MKLYDYLPSQNGWKVRALAAQLGIALKTEYVSIFEGGARTPAFLEMNPMGAVPVLELDDGRCIAESNAILCYLAEGSPLLPADPIERGRVLQWLFAEQNHIEPVIGSLRYWTLTGKLPRRAASVIDAKRTAGEQRLDMIERHLERHPFLANDRYSIADLAVYAYGHLAEDAGFSFARRPAWRAWMARVAEAAAPLPPVVPYSIDPHAHGELG